MASRKFDVVVFGATGFTGKYLVEYITKVNDVHNLKWAVAGRSTKKLKQALSEISTVTGKDLKDIPVVEADVSNSGSLADMCKNTKLVLTTVGPYKLYGEPVVKACVENGCHYVDVSGEKEFLEKMQLKYNDAAQKANVYVIGAAGFDSIPCEMGIQLLREKFEGDLNSVEVFLEILRGAAGNKLNTGTWMSMVHSVDDMVGGKKSSVSRELYKDPLPKSIHKLQPRGKLFFDDDVKRWCLPFPSPDVFAVQRSQYYNYHKRNIRPFQMDYYMEFPNIFECFGAILIGILLVIFSKFRYGVHLLEQYPHLFSFGMFSKTGPTREQVDGAKFRMTFVGTGYPEKLDPVKQHTNPPSKKLTVVVDGPEAAYATTSICMFQAGLTILEENDKLPGNGGVISVGAAFLNTSLISRLMKNGISFNVRK